jgi:hypothetical protein
LRTGTAIPKRQKSFGFHTRQKAREYWKCPKKSSSGSGKSKPSRREKP